MLSSAEQEKMQLVTWLEIKAADDYWMCLMLNFEWKPNSVEEKVKIKA